MDRFIVKAHLTGKLSNEDLKSNMDRFIGNRANNKRTHTQI